MVTFTGKDFLQGAYQFLKTMVLHASVINVWFKFFLK